MANQIENQEDSARNKELEDLKDLESQGFFNYNLYKKISKLETDPAQKLAYLRQTKLLWPLDKEIQVDIDKTRDEVKRVNGENLTTNETIEKPYFFFKYFIPNYMLSYLLIFLSIIIVVKFILASLNKTNIFNKKNFLILLLYIFILGQSFLVTNTKDGRLRLADKFEDLTKLEAVVINENIKSFSAPDSTSQITFLLKKGEEINLYSPPNPKKNVNSINEEPWIEIENASSRRGWIKGTSGLFVLNR
jgi:hypothetical protein